MARLLWTTEKTVERKRKAGKCQKPLFFGAVASSEGRDTEQGENRDLKVPTVNLNREKTRIQTSKKLLYFWSTISRKNFFFFPLSREPPFSGQTNHFSGVGRGGIENY